IYLFIFFFWQGVTTIPSEGDSLAYHIPIAESILDGTVFYPSTHGYALEYYPGSEELLLAALMFFHMPLNLFNMIGWFVLAFLALRLGQSYNLSTQLSLIFSVCSTTTIGMIRLLNNQTIDIWLAVFFVWSLLLLRHPKKSLRYFFLLGVSI